MLEIHMKIPVYLAKPLSDWGTQSRQSLQLAWVAEAEQSVGAPAPKPGSS